MGGSPRCTLNRWGTTGSTGGGSCNQDKPKTSEAKELDDKLKKMMAEREKLNNIWTQPTKESK